MGDKNNSRKSKYRGVSRAADSDLNPWFAKCQTKYLGAFPTEEDAARVYDARALEVFGTKAITNESLGLLPPATDDYKPKKSKAKKQNPFIGITRSKKNLLNPWMANISHKGKGTNIGSFPTAEDAARAYDEYAVKLRGKDARTNVSLGLLPPANPGESVLAKASRINKTTKYTGVSLIRARRKNQFRAYIEHNKKKIIIGYYPTPEDAARAYDRMAIKLRGQNAKTNVSCGLLLTSETAKNQSKKIIRYNNRHKRKAGKCPRSGDSTNAKITRRTKLPFQQKRQDGSDNPITSRKSKRLRTIPSKKGQKNEAYSCRSSPPLPYRM